MANTYERLVAAGAPAIVEPRFYRIHENYKGGLRVEVRERNPRQGSVCLAHREIEKGRPSDVLADVVQAFQDLVEDLDLKDVVADLRGDHYPTEAGK